jgi:20S proteasome subunit beta 7
MATRTSRCVGFVFVVAVLCCFIVVVVIIVVVIVVVIVVIVVVIVVIVDAAAAVVVVVVVVLVDDDDVVVVVVAVLCCCCCCCCLLFVFFVPFFQFVSLANISACMEYDFGIFYFAESVGSAFQSFYENATMQQYMGNFWSIVASRFKKNLNVIGRTELIN